MGKDITAAAGVDASALGREAFREGGESFDRFCLTAGLATLQAMPEEDATRLCGPPHGRDPDRRGHRWGRTRGKVAFHGGAVDVSRPRVRARGAREGGASRPKVGYEGSSSSYPAHRR